VCNLRLPYPLGALFWVRLCLGPVSQLEEGNVETSPEFQWDDFEQRISEALAGNSQDIRPPDWVWQCIVHGLTDPDKMGGHVKYGEDEFSIPPELLELVT
jgi:hypothetical protein